MISDCIPSDLLLFFLCVFTQKKGNEGAQKCDPVFALLLCFYVPEGGDSVYCL